jgi:hypothetical protein
MPSPFVYGDSYGQVQQSQMGLDAATAQRAIASQQMLREVQRAAAAQRQQEIATQLAAQQQADYAAQREQENQLRLASWLNQLQQQQRSYGLDREQTIYNRGRDTSLDAFNLKKFNANQKLSQDELNWRTQQPNAAQLRSQDLKDRMSEEDAQRLQASHRLAEALNRQQQLFNTGNVAIPSIESAYKRNSNWIFPDSLASGNRNTQIANLATNIPPSVTTNPNALLQGLSFADALKKVRELNDAQYQQQQGVVGELARGGAMDWVKQTDQGYVPSYTPRVPQANAASAPVPMFPPEVKFVQDLVRQGVKYDKALGLAREAFPRKY